MKGHVACASQLFSSRDLTLHASDGTSALYAAATAGHLSVVELLLSKNMDLHAERMKPPNKARPTEVDLTYPFDDPSKRFTGVNALYVAAQAGHAPVVEYLHKQEGDLHQTTDLGATLSLVHL